MTEVCFSPGRAAFHFLYVSELRRLSALCVCYDIKYEDLSCLMQESNTELSIILLYYYTEDNSQHSKQHTADKDCSKQLSYVAGLLVLR